MKCLLVYIIYKLNEYTTYIVNVTSLLFLIWKFIQRLKSIKIYGWRFHC